MKYTPFLSATVMAMALFVAGLPSTYAEDTANKADTAETAGSETHRLVIQVNKKDDELQDHVLSNIVNLQKYYGLDNIEIEVVAYGPGIWLLTDKSRFTDRIESLMMQNVIFTACGNTLDTIERTDGKRPTLLDGVETTQAGISRLMELQEKGYSYLSP